MSDTRTPFISVIIPRRGINDEGLGKKHALFRLISEVDSEYVWLRDDDVVAPSATLEEAVLYLQALGYPDMVILPLRMERGETLVQRLQYVEYCAIQQLTILSARWGCPILCSGANLLVRRQAWLESFKDLHTELVSGDDMFLLESFKRRGLVIRTVSAELVSLPSSYANLDSATLEGIVSPQPTLRSLFKQRMRWAGKSSHYTDRQILLAGAVVALSNTLQIICPLIILVKFPIEWWLCRQRDREVSMGLCLLLEMVYPFYMWICLIGGCLQTFWRTHGSQGKNAPPTF